LSWIRRKHTDGKARPAGLAGLRGPLPAGPPGDQFDVLLTAAGDKKIHVIKVLRDCTGMGLKDAKELVDRAAYSPVVIVTRLSHHDANWVSSALSAVGATVAVQPSSAVSGLDWKAQPADSPPTAVWSAALQRQFPPGPPGDQFDVVLTDSGVRKIQVIKVIREWTGYGLKETKDLVDRAEYGPVVISVGLPLSDANEVAAALMRAGAIVTVTVSSSASRDWA
jgi:large subunit ribosomal protein L7/L12